jgi:hypothetical protein
MNTLHFSSEFLTAGESNNFECQLAKPIYGIQRFKVKKCFLFEHFNSNIPEIYFFFLQNISVPTTATVTIPAGQYTGAQLATALQNGITAAETGPAVVWTVVYTADEKFEFTRTTGSLFPALEIVFQNTSPIACKVLGVEPEIYTTPGANVTWTAPYRARILNMFPIYYIATKEIETSDQVNIQMENPNNYNILTWTHAVTHVQDDIKDYKWSEMPLMDHWIEVENSMNLTNLTLIFLGAMAGEFYELDLIDSPWYLELEYQTKESIQKQQQSLNYFY